MKIVYNNTNAICWIFGHKKTYWPVGLGSEVVYVWCSRCGIDISCNEHNRILYEENQREADQQLEEL